SHIIVQAPNTSQNNDNNAPASEATEQRLQCCVKGLVRVSDLDLPGQRKFREIVRSIRMVYDSIRVMAMEEEDKEVDVCSERINLRVSAMMRRRGLGLNRDKKIIGTIPGVCIGDVFLNKMELVVVGLHGQPQAGIDYLPDIMSSNGEPIATSVIVSGGYDDSV
ncbi:histone-lysine N-methyltransferase family member SUVH9, partial [Trifolium medium]|nr:histone-lysine N-methyltransferase family member SUVH9 [Trifolium medium]